MNKTTLLITLLPPLLFAGCVTDKRTVAERDRDSRLAILKPNMIAQSAPVSSAPMDDNSSSPDCPAPPDKKCRDHDKNGDKACKREHDDKYNDEQARQRLSLGR